MSAAEFEYWAAFRRANGPLVPAFRADWQAALIVQSNVGGKLDDHLLKFYDPETPADKMRRIVRELGGDPDAQKPKKFVVRRKRSEINDDDRLDD